MKFDNYIPGPGAYTLSKKEKNINNINNTFSQISDKEIKDTISFDSPNSIKKKFKFKKKVFSQGFKKFK